MMPKPPIKRTPLYKPAGGYKPAVNGGDDPWIPEGTKRPSALSPSENCVVERPVQKGGRGRLGEKDPWTSPVAK